MRHRLAGSEEAHGWVARRVDLAIGGERDAERALSEFPGRAVCVIARESNGPGSELERWSLLRQWRGDGDEGPVVLAGERRIDAPPVIRRGRGDGSAEVLARGAVAEEVAVGDGRRRRAVRGNAAPIPMDRGAVDLRASRPGSRDGVPRGAGDERALELERGGVDRDPAGGIEQLAVVEHTVDGIDVDSEPIGRGWHGRARIRDEDGMADRQPGIILQAGEGRAQRLQAAAGDLDAAIDDLDDVAVGCYEITIDDQRTVEEIAARHIGRSTSDGRDPRQLLRRLAMENNRIEPGQLSVIALDDGSGAGGFLEIGLDAAQVDRGVAKRGGRG